MATTKSKIEFEMVMLERDDFNRTERLRRYQRLGHTLREISRYYSLPLDEVETILYWNVINRPTIQE